MSLTTPLARSRAKKSTGCACKVPIRELGVAFGSTEAMLEFYASKGIEVSNNYRGELSIPVADAQRLYDEDAERCLQDWNEQNQRRARVHEAQQARDKRLHDAMTRLIKTPGVSIAELQGAAIREALAAETDLPADIRQELTLPLFIPYTIGEK